MLSKQIRFLLILTLSCTGSLWALSKTMGTPIGGMGTGYMIYNAITGDFATSGKNMPPASDGDNEFGNKKSISSGFHFFAGGTPKIKATSTIEDAKCPIYTADFGATGGVTFKLAAFGPFIPGEDSVNAQLAQSPLAFFEITATNTTAAAVEATAAMEFTNQSESKNGLLGGANTGTSTADKHAIAYGTGETENAYLLGGCSDAGAIYNTGAIGTFATNGTLTGADGNIVSVKSTIAAGATVRFKFVMAWWRQYRNPTRGNEDYYYHNYFLNSQAVATFGLSKFDAAKTGVTKIVDLTMGSNFPTWYKQRLLNNLYPLIHNSQCAKDGRVGFWEGQYPIIGTIDQGQHAALWYINNWPSNQWRELQYWARSSHKGVAEPEDLKGQVHHDFNAVATDGWSTESHFMLPWDDYLHPDYWFMPNTTDWSDLNDMFIFKAFELMTATGDRDSLQKYWTYLCNTADRLIVQCKATHLPLETKSTYDSDKGIAPEYAATTMLPAMYAMSEMGKFLNDTLKAKKYLNWYTLGRAEFRAALFNSNFGRNKKNAEGDVAGYSWARYYNFPAILDSDIVAAGCERLTTYYTGVEDEGLRDGALGNWHFYTCDHMGGTLIAAGQPDKAMALFEADYKFYHTGNPTTVFWQDLWNTNNTYHSYMTAPSAWRSYYQMTGTTFDRANNRLWIRPTVPSSMNKQITNAPIVNPKTWGMLNYSESAEETRQTILINFDSTISCKELVLKNNSTTLTAGVNFNDKVLIISNDVAVTGFTAISEGTGFEKNIRITFAAPLQIGSTGILIKLFNTKVGVNTPRTADRHYAAQLNAGMLSPGKLVRYTVGIPGPVSLDLFSMNGARIGSIMQGNSAAGIQSFTWNGRTTDGKRISSGSVIMRLSTPGGSVSRSVIVRR